MSSKETQHLTQLLTQFDVTNLGEGDSNAGANVLSIVAVTLANLSRSGSGIQSPRLGRMRVGASLLVNGGLTASLVQDNVVTEAIVRQNNLVAQLRRLIGDKIADADKNGVRMIEFPTGPKSNYAGNALYQLEQSNPEIPMDELGLLEKWGDVIGLPPNPRIDDLAARPKLVVTARSPRDLESQLRGLHDNRPLVVLGLNSPADAAALSETCTCLLNGLLPCGDGGEMATGNLLITDPGNVLAKIAPNASDKATWLGRMPWLIDGNSGPDAIEADAGNGKARVANMSGRFGEALTRVIAKRLNNHDASPTVHPFDLDAAQMRWVEFLQDMEGRLPGITGTARSLLPTLAFGLTELATVVRGRSLPVTTAGVEALARWIIYRMANARAAMLGTAEREMLRQLAQRVVVRLSGCNLSTRDIYRSLSISAAKGDKLLLPMERGGLLHRSEGKWGLSKDASLLMADVRNLFIDV